jgi:hypothetical protein
VRKDKAISLETIYFIVMSLALETFRFQKRKQVFEVLFSGKASLNEVNFQGKSSS